MLCYDNAPAQLKPCIARSLYQFPRATFRWQAIKCSPCHQLQLITSPGFCTVVTIAAFSTIFAAPRTSPSLADLTFTMSSNLGISSHYHPRNAVLDGVGIFYIVGCGIWTVLITIGMIFLWSKRDIPFLRIRRLKLTFVATYMLHLYWILILIGYTLSPFIPEGFIFWMTSIYCVHVESPMLTSGTNRLAKIL